MFGKDLFKGKKGSNKIMQYMMMSEMMKGSGSGIATSGMGAMLPLMMMNGGGMSDMFSGMFDFEDENEESESEEE